MKFTSVHQTLSILDNMQKQVLTQNVFKLLKDLLKTLETALDEIQAAVKLDKFKQFQSKIKLCASQLTKIVPHLVDIVKGVQSPAHKEVVDYLLGKIRWCLLEVLRLFGGGGSDDDLEPSGMFVRIMDMVVFSVQKQAIDVSLKDDIEEMLCQALTIAKLSNSEDHKEISAGCKNVLVAMHEVTDVQQTENNSMKTHLLLSTLEQLERRVNVAVLRLFLELGANPNAPLKQLTTKALDKRYKPRYVSDLTSDLEELDIHCERIQLVGNFAVACSKDPTLKIKILCCLASVEYCENYFRPSAEEFYLSPLEPNKKEFFKFLVEDYHKEMKELINLIDWVVDTETLIQVALSDLSPLVQEIKENISFFQKQGAEGVLSKCIRLAKHMHTARDETFVGNPKVVEAVNEFEWILKRYQTCLRRNVFNSKSMHEVIDSMHSTLSTLRKVADLIAEYRITNSLVSNDTKYVVDETLNQTTSLPATNMLEPYLVKVLETPRLKSSLYAITPKKTPRKLLPFMTKPEQISLNISDVLDDIQDLSATFGPDGASQNPSLPVNETGDHKESLNNCESPGTASTSSLADFPSDVDTLGRFEDILLLDDKINRLKIT